MNDLEYWIWISSLMGTGASKTYSLLQLYSDPKIIYHLTREELKNTNILSDKNIDEILDVTKREYTKLNFELMYRNKIKMINIYDECYPSCLKNIYDPPIALYYKGNLEFRDFAIAVVGSRRTTRYGANAAKKLSYGLSMRGVQIISGLARGIDSIAHQGCLEAKGNTIAVLGSGIDQIYPPENSRLMCEIIENNGMVISEYPPGVQPLQHHFPARNRIISGLSLGVLVIEAAKRSGSLITANYALEQGREVFAVPGNIDSIFSEGTNKLIKDGAKMISCTQDILEEFGFNCMENTGAENSNEKGIFEDDIDNNYQGMNTKNLFSIFKGLSTEEIRVAKTIILGYSHIEEIIANCHLDAKTAVNILFMLEMKGVIQQLPGKNFELCQA